jgi:hypothetical protein
MKRNNELFYRITAIAAFVTAGTTFFLWLLPHLYEAPTNFEKALLLSDNVIYLSKQWINLLHIPLALTAYFGLAYKLRDRELPKVSLGLIWFIMWAITEMIGVSIIIFSVNKNWRANYTSASESQQEIYQSNIEAFYSTWDSMFFVLLIAFLLGTLFYSWATFNGKGIEKYLSYLFLLAAPLTLLIILSSYASVSWAGTIVTWTYPILQPISRFVLGLYLWRSSNSGQIQTANN